MSRYMSIVNLVVKIIDFVAVSMHPAAHLPVCTHKYPCRVYVLLLELSSLVLMRPILAQVACMRMKVTNGLACHGHDAVTLLPPA